MSADSPEHVTSLQVNLFCADVERTAGFFVAMGFPERFRAPAEGSVEHIEVEVAGTRIGLTSVDAVNRIDGLDVATQATVTSELVLWCRDVDSVVRAAVDAGAVSLALPRDSPDARIRYGWVQAPGGHQVKFVAPI
jgi:hypothetical protein